MVAEVEQVYAGRVIAREERVPEGELAREAFVTLLERGSLFGRTVRQSAETLRLSGLQARLEGLPAPPSLHDWLAERVTELGIESGTDLALLSPGDFAAEPLAPDVQERLEKDFPSERSIGGTVYTLTYEPERSTCIVTRKSGPKQAPSLRYLPSLPGWRIVYRDKSAERILRQRAR